MSFGSTEQNYEIKAHFVFKNINLHFKSEQSTAAIIDIVSFYCSF